MDKMLFKKINLLLHLANVDGKFDRSEENLLLDILKEKGLDGSYLKEHQQETVDLKAFQEIPDKAELFYWVLKMIKADNYLHPDELAYSKTLALKLNIKPEVVDLYSNKEIPSLEEFELEIKQFRLSS